MTSQDALPGGHRVRWYEIESLIGRGAMCHTYLATDHNLQRQVVIKEFFPGRICVRDDDYSVVPASVQMAQAYQTLKENFVAEAKTLAQYRLENIVQVHTTFELNQTAYLVMTHEQGGSLASMIAESVEPLSEKMLLDILRPVIDGLAKIHNVAVTHGDINPSNIIIRGYGAPVLVDIGSSRSLASQMRWQHSLPSSVGYAPIEMLDGTAGTAGAWSDIYALSATLYHAVAQHSAVDSLQRASAVGAGRTDPYRSLASGPKRQYSVGFLAAIDSGMSLKPRQRPQNIRAWENHLRGIVDPTQLAPPVANNNALLPRKTSEEVLGVHRVGAENTVKTAPAKAPLPTQNPPLVQHPPVADTFPPADLSEPVSVVPEDVPVELIAELAPGRRRFTLSHAGLAAGVALLMVPVVYLGIANYPGTPLQAANRTAAVNDTVPSDQSSAAAQQAQTTAPLAVAENANAVDTPVELADAGEQAALEETSEVALNTVAIPEQFSAVVAEPTMQQLAAKAADEQTVTELLSAVSCGSFLPVENGLKLDGVITKTALDWISPNLPVDIAENDTENLVVLDDVFCAPLLALKEIKDPAQVTLATENNNTRFREGDRLVLKLAVDAYEDNYVYVDYFTMDGAVLHMLSSQTTTDSNANFLMRGESMLLGEPGDIERWDISRPYGNELISVMVSDSPLDIESTEEVEDAQVYLDRVKQVLAASGARTVSSFIPITIEK